MSEPGKGLRMVSKDPAEVQFVRTIGQRLAGKDIPRKALAAAAKMEARCGCSTEVYKIPDFFGQRLICVAALREGERPLLVGWAERLKVRPRVSPRGKAQICWVIVGLTATTIFCSYIADVGAFNIFELTPYISIGLAATAVSGTVLGWLTLPTLSLLKRALHWVATKRTGP